MAKKLLEMCMKILTINFRHSANSFLQPFSTCVDVRSRQCVAMNGSASRKFHNFILVCTTPCSCEGVYKSILRRNIKVVLLKFSKCDKRRKASIGPPVDLTPQARAQIVQTPCLMRCLEQIRLGFEMKGKKNVKHNERPEGETTACKRRRTFSDQEAASIQFSLRANKPQTIPATCSMSFLTF
eukprot:881020-Pelagomonas_calceolata.AAC.7